MLRNSHAGEFVVCLLRPYAVLDWIQHALVCAMRMVLVDLKIKPGLSKNIELRHLIPRIIPQVCFSRTHSHQLVVL